MRRTLITALALASLGLTGCVIVISDEGITSDRDGLRLGDDHAHRSGDRALAAQVRDALELDPMLKGVDFSVAASDGVVTLRGRVADIASFDRAVELARNTKGVDKVVSRLVVEVK